MDEAWSLEKAGRMRVTRVTRAVLETPSDATLEFRDEAPMAPGQFFMVWVLGAEEVPMSASRIGPGGKRAVTARNFGDTTAKMRTLKAGDRIGVRGPFGNGFSMKWKKPLFVGGGVGASSIITAIDAWAARGRKPCVVIGGRTKDELLYERRLKRLGADLHWTTDDGTRGAKGTAVARAMELVDARGFTDIIACGPERMLVALQRESAKRRVRVEAALERLMKCAMGVCDICSIDGVRVCREGPIFDSKFMASSRQFGNVELNSCGHLEPI